MSTICQELGERFEQFKRRDLGGICLVALFLDATYLNVRPETKAGGGPGVHQAGESVLFAVMLGMREASEDWPGAGAEHVCVLLELISRYKSGKRKDIV